MKATVFYLSPSDDQRDAINRGGWESEIGRAYIGPKFAHKSKASEAVNIAFKAGLYRKAAEVEVGGRFPETVWSALQNLDTPWTERHEPLTDFPRSMDIGDLIFWPDGEIQMVAPVGFVRVSGEVEKLMEGSA